MNKLFLIDGHALVFKMYYAFLRRPMVNSKGADTSILYGFTKYLLELIEREKPTHIAVAFDPPGGTFRNEMYAEYKANRPPTPQLIIDALDPLKEIVAALNIPVLMVKGFEADDVIGSMSKRCAARGDFDVYMVTPDKDYGQLVEEHIFQYKPGKSGNENEVLGVKEICAKYGIERPSQVIEMLAICGDASDNVPGVKGVGEVGAGKLIAKYSSVEGIYAHLDELPPRQKAMFEEAREHMPLSHELVTIKTDIPLETTEEEMALDMEWSPAIADIFNKYEFPSLEKYISGVHKKEKTGPQVKLETEEVSPGMLMKAARSAGRCAVITEAVSPDIFSDVTSVILCCPHGGGYIVSKSSAQEFRPVLEDAAVTKYGYDLKLQLNQLSRAGIALRGKLMDVALMHYLLDPEKSHQLDILARSYLGIDLETTEDEDNAVTGDLFADVPEPQEKNRSKEAAAILMVSDRITAQMQEEGVVDLYDRIEEPLAKVLGKMERAGVRVDLSSMQDFSDELRKEMNLREARVREITGEPDINVSSPQQIGQALFDKMKLDPKMRKTSRGAYPTDENTLLKLRDKSPVIDEILEYRTARKLLSTYIEPFGKWISRVDGKVHTTFNQALTSTGRLSSSAPNLQNIPIRTERGRTIRKAFVPSTPQGLLLSADYSQIELRVMAHFSRDEHMVTAFNEGTDVHKATASKIFGTPMEEVTPDQRRIAKTANFGIMYGISSFGLAERLHIGRSEAKKIIEDYFNSFPSIQSFINSTLEKARKDGYVETLFGRRRYIPDINTRNATLRALAERNAVNAPIQGTAADIIKLAMINVDRRIEEAGLRSRMVLQIHDELVFDTFPDEVEALREIVVSEMEGVTRLNVPLTVECNYGKNWLEAH